MSDQNLQPEDERLLSAAETAALLGVSRMTVYRMVDRGDIQATRVGPRLLRVPASEVERIIAGSARAR